jgi:peroxiredoxin
MNIITKTTLALALAAGTSLAAPEVGQPAPAFTLTDSNGQSHNLADFKGKFVVLEWLNHGCPFVKKHYDSNNMQKLQKEYTGKDVVWLSIVSSAPGKQGHMSPAETNQAKEEKGSAATAVLLDEDGTVGQLYGAKVTPHIYVIDREGKLAYMGGLDNAPLGKAEGPSVMPWTDEAIAAVVRGEAPRSPSTKAYGCSVKYKG